MFRAVIVSLVFVGAAGAQSNVWVMLNARSAPIDTVYDWLTAVGLSYANKHVKLIGEIARARQNGRKYIDQDYSAAGVAMGFEVGSRLVNSQKSGLYLLSVYAERKFWENHVGFGVTQNWTEKWTENAETMLRLSFFWADSIGPAAVLTNASYDRNRSRQHFSLRFDAPFTWRRLSMGPFVNIQRVEPKGADAILRWETALKISYAITRKR